MRDILVVMVLAVVVFLGVRQCGCFSSSDGEAAALQDVTLGSAGVSGEIAAEAGSHKEGLVAGAEGVEEDASQMGLGRAGMEWFRSAARSLAAGRKVENLQELSALAATAGSTGVLSRAFRDAMGDDLVRAWLGMTRLQEAGLLKGEDDKPLLQKIETTARRAVLSPSESFVYTVLPGDSLHRIRSKVHKAEGVNVSVGELRWLNQLEGDIIRPGEELRIPRKPLSLWASKGSYLLRVYIGSGLVREYPIGLGRDEKTPIGSFVLKAPMIHPPWRDPVSGKIIHHGEPGYAIGTRWIGFERKGPYRGLGIHGTDQPQTIGKALSLGCIRMQNHDVEALAELVPAGSSIKIVKGP